MTERYINSEVGQNKVEVKTISGQGLLNLIFPEESLLIPDLLHRVDYGDLPQDKRFIKLYEGGVFEYFDPKDLITTVDTSFYPTVEIDNKIVALSKLRKSPFKKREFLVDFLSVDPKYQNKGYATKLIEEIFSFTEKKGNSLKFTMFSPEGRQKIKRVVERCAEKSSVQVFYS